MSKSWGKSTGPWANWNKLDSIWTIGGWPIAAKFVADEQSGLFFNVASPLFGSLVLGWYPDHKAAGCVTGFGQPYDSQLGIEPMHYCWAAQQPHVELGPDPRELQAAGVQRRIRLQELRERIELRLLGAAA